MLLLDSAQAVASPAGLVVPVLRNTESMSFKDIEMAIADYGAKAKSGQLSMEDMAGGTFTISNGGVFGSLMGTPIINQPQVRRISLSNGSMETLSHDVAGFGLSFSIPFFSRGLGGVHLDNTECDSGHARDQAEASGG